MGEMCKEESVAFIMAISENLSDETEKKNLFLHAQSQSRGSMMRE